MCESVQQGERREVRKWHSLLIFSIKKYAYVGVGRSKKPRNLLRNLWTVPSSSAIRLFWVLLFNSNDVTRWLSLPCYTKFEKVRLLCIYLDLGWFNNYQWQSGFITFSLIKWIWIRIKFEEEESFKINAEIFRHVLSGCKKCLVLNYSEDPSIFKFADSLFFLNLNF